MEQKDGALVLAAGKGTRMFSPKAKVLQTLLGDTMLACVHHALRPLFAGNIWTLVGHDANKVVEELAEIQGLNLSKQWLDKRPQNFAQCNAIEQVPQQGTGHALMVAFPFLRQAGLKRVLVVNGDVPLIDSTTLSHFIDKASKSQAQVAFLTLHLDDISSYGRVLRHPNGAVKSIVEAKDYKLELHGPLSQEVNAGIYLLNMDALESLLPLLSNNNAAHEYYITDIVSLALAQGFTVLGQNANSTCGQETHLLGANTPLELIQAEEFLQAQRVQSLLAQGVLLHQPSSIRVGLQAHIEPGAEIFGPCEVYGKSHLLAGCVVESHCFIKHSIIESGCVLRSFSHAEQAHLGHNCTVGPYTRLRPGAVLEENAHVGNFVELKNAHMEAGAKANHLSYLGDVHVGAGSNIGAGTITCNYDGKLKHHTEIGPKAFIGSNTSLVAPVTIGENALIGAGSVITKDVPDNNLAVARGRQTNLPKKLPKGLPPLGTPPGGQCPPDPAVEVAK